MSVTDITKLYNYHNQRQGIGMENQFIRHEPCFERILFVLTLDRKKMKERILIGEEQQIRFRLNGSQNAEVLCDMTRPLGTFLINFECDTDRDWNLYGLSPLRQALHSNRWKQPELEQAASEFLWEKYLSNDPLKMYVAFRICPCHAQSLSKKFPAGVSYHKAPLRFGSRPDGSGSAVLPQSKSALSFSSCPMSGQTKSSQNMAHAV